MPPLRRSLDAQKALMSERSDELLKRLEWLHRQREIALGRKLEPSEELVRLREELKPSGSDR
jgi:hypothetical protein